MSDSETKILMRFGKRIRQLRTERALSQEDFANICELDRTYIGGVERGERNISLTNISKIASAFGLSISELFEWSNG